MTEDEIKQAAFVYASRMINNGPHPTIEQSFIAGADTAAPKWIPKSQCDPEFFKDFLGLTENGRCMIMVIDLAYCDDYRCFNSSTMDEITYTHWMPLPSLLSMH